ncbi:S-adenosyl-L-methionine-dependent methyltransferase [Pseudomassariella vexata]|uniref:S-adenosyl-L-methionine-dependent methyltransferase n=1 Tax=Pseudomassariella vexata TaxID=1141098 RepID=A0A1Y2EBA5_9PEZI|nr:S-adenosyl-L-methionine-dependent methyltransferase [Pseudomassariella vexata]ORY68863.1 S-adenosyl-L-methionine-dependent methyltransferase [Pseudomassariella vexata]
MANYQYSVPEQDPKMERQPPNILPFPSQIKAYDQSASHSNTALKVEAGSPRQANPGWDMSYDNGQLPNPSTNTTQHQGPPQAEYIVRGPLTSNSGQSKYTHTGGGRGVQFENFYIPTELIHRVPSDASVVEPDSVLGDSGRLYHGYKDGKYFLPNDGLEQDRLDLQYAAIHMILHERLAWAPMLIQPRHVLDIATGTGIWAIEFAEQNPTAQVIGTDLSAIQPHNSTPPNCVFIKEDSEEEWLFDQKFDYVHLRMVVTCFEDKKRVIKHAFDNLNAGGWIEFQDTESHIHSMDNNLQDSPFNIWVKSIVQGAAAMGRDLKVAGKYKEWLLEAGFVDVEEIRFRFPYGTWPDDPRFKKIGAFCRQNMIEGARAIGWKMLTGRGLTAQEIEQLTENAKAELMDPHKRFYGYFYVVYGRKPFEWESSNDLA